MQNNRKQIERVPVPEWIRFSKSGFPEFKVMEEREQDLSICEIIVYQDPEFLKTMSEQN